ncbi:MAG: (Na+)-NQR maturation NqrM [Enterobacteriaceae bacterium]
MILFIITFALFLLLVAAMSIGYILQRKKIHGSCGGIAALGLEKVCDCPEPCEARKARDRAARLREQRII